MPHPVFASPDKKEQKQSPFEFDFQLAYGRESNVFLSDSNAKSDTFLQIESTLSHLYQPTTRSILFSIFSASHARFFRYEQANRSFLTLSSYYRYMMKSALGAGFANTLSYTDLKLSDSEGAALPIDQFKAISDRLRLYGQYNTSKTHRLTLGVFYQVFDVEEVAGEDSLDYRTQGLDLVSRLRWNTHRSLEFKYLLSQINYAERKALNQNLNDVEATDGGNPNLELKRQEFSARLKLRRSQAVSFKVRLKIRINDDIFQNYLSYRQVEFKTGFERIGLSLADITLDLTYRNRHYSNRKNETEAELLLEENFVIVDLKLIRKISSWLWVSLRQSGTWKSSNRPSGDFANHQTLLSLESRW